MTIANVGVASSPQRPRSSVVTPPAESSPNLYTSKNLKRLMQGLAACGAPHLLDLGRLSGQNIEWLIHHRCKVTVDDQITHLRPVPLPSPPPLNRPAKAKAAPAVFTLELPHPAEGFDAVLCWDLFDYLDYPGTQRSLTRLAALLRPGGYLLAFFNCQRSATRPALRYRIVNEEQLEHAPLPQHPLPGRVHENREIQEFFSAFEIVNSCYLKSQMREILVQKKVTRPPKP